MGDRGNIVLRFQVEPKKFQDIYFYTHWGGSDIAQMLQKALLRKERWDDPPYLARIIFDTMTEGVHGEETGFGIAPFQTDNEHDYLLVDTEAKKVLQFSRGNDLQGEPLKTWEFMEFIELDPLPEV